MKKRSLAKREIILILVTGVSLLLVAATAIYAGKLRATNQSNKTIVENEGASLRRQGVEANETSNYIETICAEYRKLYQAYTNLRAQHPVSDESYALPGSAKGEVDECYQSN